MNIIVAENYDEMSRRAADEIVACVTDNPSCVLGLATGSTPIGLYADLVADCEAGKVSFKDVMTFNLDEYVGLSADHVQSYRYFMTDNLFGHVDIDVDRTFVPSGAPESVEDFCEEYEQAIIDAGGIDLQLLGLGHNGHIGFNEPSDVFPKMTHEVDLTESTIEANSRLFASKEEVPRQAITMGVGTIMAARKIVVVANGEDKAAIVRQAFFGPVTPEVPASILQFHPNVVVIVDEAAASAIDEEAF